MGDVSIENPTEISDDRATGLNVILKEQTTQIVDLLFHRAIQEPTLAMTAVVDSLTFEMSPGHGFVIGQGMFILEGQNFSQFNVLNVVSDTITVDSPIDFAFTTSASVFRKTFDLREDGSVTPSIFSVTPNPGQIWEITRIILVMESTAKDMEYGEFGSLSKLTNGCVLRVAGPINKNVFNWKDNGEFIARSDDYQFTPKPGGGEVSGFMAITTFGGSGNRGVVARVDGSQNQEMQVIIQDDISSVGSLTKFQMIAQGHVATEIEN